jgi:hypothetical protein
VNDRHASMIPEGACSTVDEIVTVRASRNDTEQ